MYEYHRGEVSTTNQGSTKLQSDKPNTELKHSATKMQPKACSLQSVSLTMP